MSEDNKELFEKLSEESATEAPKAFGLGSLNGATFNSLSGVNVNGGAVLLPQNEDDRGFAFFTRPDMNLSYDNTANIRKFQGLLSEDPNSIGRAFKTMLSRRNRLKYSDNKSSTTVPYMSTENLPTNLRDYQLEEIKKSVALEQIGSNIVSENNPFISLLTNSLLTLSGWPDHSVESFVSEPGMHKEQISFVDSRVGNNQVFPLNLTFRNMEGDPITALFSLWCEYMERVAENTMMPWPDNLVDRRIDYQTRIYRVVLDITKTRVTHISSAICYPSVDPTGAVFNYDVNVRENQQEINVSMQCVKAEYDDMILIEEFNKTVTFFNIPMRILREQQAIDQLVRGEKFIKDDTGNVEIVVLNKDEELALNHRSTPYISSSLKFGPVLLWLVTKEVYDSEYSEG